MKTLLLLLGCLGLTLTSLRASAPQTNWAGANDTVAGQATTLSGNATDPDGDLSFVKFYVTGPGMPGWNEVGTVWIGGGDATPSMDWTPSQSGGYAVHMRAWDSEGTVDWNGNQAGGFNVSSPNSAPQTNWSSGDNIVAGQATTLRGNASDPDGNLSSINFYVTGPGMPGWNYVGSAGLSGGDSTGELNWTPPGPGSYAVHVRAWDTWGWVDWNGNVASGFEVAEGNHPPHTESVQASAATAGSPMTFTGRATDPDGNLTWMHFYVSGPGYSGWTYIGSAAAGGGDASRTLGWTPPQKGSYAVHIRAQDVENLYDWNANVASNFTVSGRPPTGSIAASATSISVGQQVVLTVNGTDLDGDLHYINIDQTSPNNGYYGPGNTGTQTPPNNGANSLGGYFQSASRQLTLTLGAAGTYVFKGALNDDSGWRNTDSVTVNVSVPPDTTAPSTPGGFQASLITPNSFLLSWQPSTDNVGVTGYEVRKYWMVGQQSFAQPMGTVSIPSINFSGLLPNTTYTISVWAKDAAGFSSPTGQATVITTDGNPPAADASAWFDVNGDGIRDEIIKGGTGRLNYYISNIQTQTTGTGGLDFNDFWFVSDLFYNVNNWINGSNSGLNNTNVGPLGRVWLPSWYEPENPLKTYVDLTIDFGVEAGYEYVFQWRSGDGLFMGTQTILAQTSGIQTLYKTGWDADDLLGMAFSLVRIGRPMGSIELLDQNGNLIGSVTGDGEPVILHAGIPFTARARDIYGRLLGSGPQGAWRLLDMQGNVLGDWQVGDSPTMLQQLVGLFQLVFKQDNAPSKTIIVAAGVPIDLAPYGSSLTLMDTLQISPSVGTVPQGATSSYSFEMRKTTAPDTQWSVVATGNQPSASWVAKVAGKFFVRVRLTVNGVTTSSPPRAVFVNFPSATQMKANAWLMAKMAQSWQETLAATTPTTRREQGFFITVDTATGAYGSTPIPDKPGENVNNTTRASVQLGTRPDDGNPRFPNPLQTTVYVIGMFHTHTPTTYLSFAKGVGPSGDEDANTDDYKAYNQRGLPGFVYDYVEASPGLGFIPAGYSLMSPAMVYTVREEPRETPEY
jgi:hypothetical protein